LYSCDVCGHLLLWYVVVLAIVMLYDYVQLNLRSDTPIQVKDIFQYRKITYNNIYITTIKLRHATWNETKTISDAITRAREDAITST